MKCPTCAGIGKVGYTRYVCKNPRTAGKKCRSCNGTGNVLTREELKQGNVYEAKKPKPAGIAGYINDRQILRIGTTTVQYDSPSVDPGRKYPTVTIDTFLKWASRDVSEEMPEGEWRTKDELSG